MVFHGDIRVHMSQRGVEAGGPGAKPAPRPAATAESAEELIPTIYEVVGASLDLDPDEDPIPVRDQIEPDALEQLFNRGNGDAYVSFPVEGRRVTVHSDGDVFVHDFAER